MALFTILVGNKMEEITNEEDLLVLPQIRCTCLKLVGNKWDKYLSLLNQGIPANEIWKQLEITRTCCMRTMMSPIQYEIPNQNQDLVDGLIELGMSNNRSERLSDISRSMSQLSVERERDISLQSNIEQSSARTFRSQPPTVRGIRSTANKTPSTTSTNTNTNTNTTASTTTTTSTNTTTIAPLTQGFTPTPTQTIPSILPVAVQTTQATPVKMVSVGNGLFVPELPVRMFYGR
jgi:DNA-directed RNA polymerase subunit N (RpoN/RPB10)